MYTSIDICYLAILAKNLVVEYSTVANPDNEKVRGVAVEYFI